MIPRRSFISRTSAGAVGCILAPRTILAASPPDLLAVAAAHVRLAEARGRSGLWGRIGGSAAEHNSSRLFLKQIKLYVRDTELEAFPFSAHRPLRWNLTVQVKDGTQILHSAVPTPFDARFRDNVVHGLPVLVVSDFDWNVVRGKLAFVRATMQGSPARNSIREGNLYKRAVESGAAGLIFSLPMKPDGWQAVVPIDKAYAMQDETYPDKIRPIPCFCVDARDGELIERAASQRERLSATIDYERSVEREGLNVVGYLPGKGERKVALFNHLDSFFSGANDNASGLATTIGLAFRISRMPIEKRPAHFFFVALSAHHDSAAGMRAFAASDPQRFASLDQAILIEHTDAQGGREAKDAGWPSRLNDLRQAYLGVGGWPEVRSALPRLVKESGVMSVNPQAVDACIGDLLAVCDRFKSFSLIQAPPYYHTNHDTIDKISRTGLEASVDFHIRLLETTGALRNLT